MTTALAGSSIDTALLREEAKTFSSLVHFRKKYLASVTDVESAPFHHRWSDMLLRGKGHYACEGFRESGKDQYVFQAYLLHTLTYPLPDRAYVVIVASTQTLASGKLKDVTRQFQGRDREALRTEVDEVVEDTAQSFQVRYQGGLQVRIEAYGKGAAIRGLVWGTKRPDILILNDLQDLEDMSSPTTLNKDWGWFLGDVMFLGNATRIFMIGNNMGESCIIERVAASSRQLGFSFERIPILKEVDGVKESVWPEKFPTDMVLGERESYRAIGQGDVWDRERMCLSMSPESRPLKVSDLRYYDEYSLDLAGCSIITMVDPGISLKSSSDPTVVCTVAIRDDGTRDILDMDRDRRDLSSTVDAIFRAVTRWGPQSVGIETVSAQEYLAQTLEAEMRRRGVFFSLVRVKTRREKVAKITGRLAPLLKTGSLRVPRHAPWLQDFLDEMAMFPTASGHDDMLDALSMIDDARTIRLVSSFDSSTCVSPDIPIPSHWPRWGSMVTDPTGEAVLLLLSCSPEGRYYITDQVFASLPADRLYSRFRDMLDGRRIQHVVAPESMWKSNPVTNRAWVQTYMNAGFRLVPGGDDWDNQVANLSRLFSGDRDSPPKLQVFNRCKRLLWELYNAGAGEARSQDRKSIQALMLVLGIGPKWKDVEASGRVTSGRNLRYPERDVP